MLSRVQRILSAIELFALVLWIGGLFFLTAFAGHIRAYAVGESTESIASVIYTMYGRFNSLEIVFALVVLASNFVKVVLYGKAIQMQKAALLVATFMLVITVIYSYNLRPRLEERMTEIAATTVATRGGGSQPMQLDEVRRFEDLRDKYEVLLKANLLLGLFMVYAFRTFEDRKLQALARIFQTQQP